MWHPALLQSWGHGSQRSPAAAHGISAGQSAREFSRLLALNWEAKVPSLLVLRHD